MIKMKRGGTSSHHPMTSFGLSLGNLIDESRPMAKGVIYHRPSFLMTNLASSMLSKTFLRLEGSVERALDSSLSLIGFSDRERAMATLSSLDRASKTFAA